MFIDYHTHHERCGHATGTIREYIEAAIKKGVEEIGVSDHMPVIHIEKEKIYSGTAMELRELEHYVQEVLDLKQEYKKDIQVKLGLEADYIEGHEEEIEKLLSPYPFDYIIGSVHFLGEWDFSDSRQKHGWEKQSIADIYTNYYQAVQGAARSGLYDIIGHFDVIKKFGHQPNQSMTSIIDETLQTIKKQDMVMELNTSGLFKEIKEVFPSTQILKKAIEIGILFTLGSDAHRPDHVHVGLEEGRKILQSAGAEYIVTFTERKKGFIPIGSGMES